MRYRFRVEKHYTLFVWINILNHHATKWRSAVLGVIVEQTVFIIIVVLVAVQAIGDTFLV